MSEAGTSKLPLTPQSHTQSPRHPPPPWLTSSSWWRWGRRWRGRSRPAADASAWGRCRCPPRRPSAPPSSPSTWRRRPGGTAAGGEDRSVVSGTCRLCAHVWTAEYADREYVRETSVNHKCANSYFPHYLDTQESAKRCVHCAYRSSPSV